MMPVWENRRSAGADAIFEMVCGYATGIREAKPLTFLRAYSDDSGSDVGDRRLFIAGYLNSAEKWALFADAWDDELKSGRRIDYLKMSEANGLRGEFRGWSDPQRDEKLRGLVRVARHFKPISFHVSVDRTVVDTYKPTAPRGLGSAHFLACWGVVATVSRFAAQQKGNIPIEFIFDKQDGVEDDINLFFDELTKGLPRAARRLVANKPVFRDDKQLVPLQAADLLAWHLRRNHEVNGSWNSFAENQPDLCDQRGHLFVELDALLPSWAAQFSNMPAIENMKSKSEWKALKREVRSALAKGFVPPYGTRWKNFSHSIRSKVAALLGK